MAPLQGAADCDGGGVSRPSVGSPPPGTAAPIATPLGRVPPVAPLEPTGLDLVLPSWLGRYLGVQFP